MTSQESYNSIERTINILISIFYTLLKLTYFEFIFEFVGQKFCINRVHLKQQLTDGTCIITSYSGSVIVP